MTSILNGLHYTIINSLPPYCVAHAKPPVHDCPMISYIAVGGSEAIWLASATAPWPILVFFRRPNETSSIPHVLPYTVSAVCLRVSLKNTHSGFCILALERILCLMAGHRQLNLDNELMRIRCLYRRQARALFSYSWLFSLKMVVRLKRTQLWCIAIQYILEGGSVGCELRKIVGISRRILTATINCQRRQDTETDWNGTSMRKQCTTMHRRWDFVLFLSSLVSREGSF